MSDGPITLPNTSLTQSAWLAQLRQISDELKSGSDRAVAIVGVALLDEMLRQALEAMFHPTLSVRDRADLFEGPAAALGTYASRTRMARALGLFQDNFQKDLRLLGRVRNRFAHDLAVTSFEEPGIAGLCEQLLGYRTEHIARDGTATPWVEWRSGKDARQAFIATITSAVYLLMIFLNTKGLIRSDA